MYTNIKSFKGACKVLALDPKKVLPYPETTKDPEERATNAFRKLSTIRTALNGDWVADWNNYNQYKYTPYFVMGSGFSFDDSYYARTDSSVGSRLVFASREISDYAGKQFLPIYRDMMVISK